MDFDDILTILGDWGRYQTRFYLMVTLPIAFKGLQVMMVVFTVFVPRHRCAVPGYDNDTFAIVSEQHRQLVLDTIPHTIVDNQELFDPCHIYADNFTTMTVNGSRRMQTCDRWVYDQSEMASTLISQFDLVCTKKDVRAHSNMMMMAGFLAGSVVSSVLCDWVGRKKLYCCCLMIMAVAGIISAFPQSPAALLVYRFLNGLGLMGVMVTGFVLALELVGKTRRAQAGAAYQIVWLTGPFVMVGLSFCLKHWQHIQLAAAVPTAAFVVYWWIVPESPRWLFAKGRIQEGMATLNKVAQVNGVTLPDDLASRAHNSYARRYSEKPRDAAFAPLKMVKYPTLVLRAVIVAFNWAVIAMTYYGLSLNVSNLAGSLRVNFLLSCLVELAGYMTALFLMDYAGRRKVHAGSMLTAGIACLLTIFTVLFARQDLQWITTALALIGKLGVSSSFAIIYLYSAELYPTVMRNFGVGCGSMFGRVGSLLSPYIADLAVFIEGPFSAALPLIVFGSLAVAAGVVSLLLPETLRQKLPEALSDAVIFGKDRGDVLTEEEAATENNEFNIQLNKKDEIET